MTLPAWVTGSDIGLCVGVIAGGFLLRRWQKMHNDFDLSDLVTGDNGKVSATKFIQTATWAVTTWGFVTLTQQGKMTEWYMAAYLGLAFSAKAIKDIYAIRQAPTVPQEKPNEPA